MDPIELITLLVDAVGATAQWLVTTRGGRSTLLVVGAALATTLFAVRR